MTNWAGNKWKLSVKQIRYAIDKNKYKVYNVCVI